MKDIASWLSRPIPTEKPAATLIELPVDVKAKIAANVAVNDATLRFISKDWSKVWRAQPERRPCNTKLTYKQLKRVLNNTILTELNLENCLSTGETQLKKVADAIKNNPNLTLLDLSNNASVIRFDTIHTITKALSETNNIQTLKLSENPIGEEGQKKIIELLTTNKTLTELDISGCFPHTRDNATDELAKAVQNNNTLKKLYCKEINKLNAHKFVNGVLTDLKITIKELTDVNSIDIIKTLKHDTVLEHLWVDSNWSIPVQKCKNDSQLILNDLDWKTSSCFIFAKLATFNPELTRVELRNNSLFQSSDFVFDYSAFAVFLNMLQRTHKLNHVDIRGDITINHPHLEGYGVMFLSTGVFVHYDVQAYIKELKDTSKQRGITLLLHDSNSRCKVM